MVNTMNNATPPLNDLGPKPAPHMIRHDRDCFEHVFTEVWYHAIRANVARRRGPLGHGFCDPRFDTYAEAIAWAGEGGTVYMGKSDVRRRTKWM